MNFLCQEQKINLKSLQHTMHIINFALSILIDHSLLSLGTKRKKKDTRDAIMTLEV